MFITNICDLSPECPRSSQKGVPTGATHPKQLSTNFTPFFLSIYARASQAFEDHVREHQSVARHHGNQLRLHADFDGW
jgi:hypothetical protein